MSSIQLYNTARRLGRVGLARAVMSRLSSGRNRFYGGARSNRLATGIRQRAARSWTITRNRQKSTRSGQGVTTQHDRRNIYVKTRQPSFKRRRWGRFVKKVQAVAERDLGTRTVVMNKAIAYTNTTATAQLVGAAYLYGQRGLASDAAQDLFLIGSLENTGDPSAAAGITTWGSTKLMFQSAVLDLTLRNASTFIGAGPITVPASEAKMELDVYELSVSKATEETGATYTSIQSLLADNNSEITPIGGAGTELIYTMRGSTPWDQTYSLARWGIRIWKKTKFFINNQDTITYQVRDPRRHTLTRDDCVSSDGFNRRGWTRILLFVGKLVPGLQVGSELNTYQERIEIGLTRKYMYKVEGANDDRASYITT